MRLHSEYNIALRLSGLLFQVLLLTVPPIVATLLLISSLSSAWPVLSWLDSLLEWSLVMGAIASVLLFVGSLWDAI